MPWLFEHDLLHTPAKEIVAKRFPPIDLRALSAEGPAMPNKQELLDLQFIDARHKLLDLAAFLDRIDRHPGGEDFRITAMKNALPILWSDQPDRARAILEAFSDQSAELPQTAPFQGAFGAPPISDL